MVKYSMNRVQATKICDRFTRNERYLRSLVKEITGDGEYSGTLNYGRLVAEGRKIREMAQEMLSDSRDEKPSIDKKLNAEPQVKNRPQQLLLFS